MGAKRSRPVTRIVWMAAAVFLVAACASSTRGRVVLPEETASSLPGKFVELSRGSVYYQLAGPPGGTTVILVHGFSVPSYVWDPTFDALVGAGYRVLRYDSYGRGLSDRPRLAYDVDLFLGQLEELVDTLGLPGPLVPAGLSFGGPIAAAYANRHPEDVAGVCLMAPQAATVAASEVFPMNLPLIGELIVAAYLVPVMLPKAQSEDFFRPERFPDWEDRYREQLNHRGFGRGILSTIRKMVGVDPLAAYRSLGGTDLPVALFWGLEDQSISAEDIEAVREAVPDLEFHPIEEAGHLAHFERPEVVNPKLIEFLRRLAP